MAGIRPPRYPVSVPAPDLSQVLNIADATGENQGYNEFMTSLIDEQRKRADAAEAARVREEQRLAAEQRAEQRKLASEKRAEKRQIAGEIRRKKLNATAKAKDALANAGSKAAKNQNGVNGSGGKSGGGGGGFWHGLTDHGAAFFSKAADVSLHGLEFTIDQISRPLHGVANAVEAMDNTKSGLHGFTNTGNFVGGDQSVASAFMRGLENKDKTTFSNVIKNHAVKDKKHNILDNPWFQGIGGFAGDVAFDPTSYIGAGIVTKPLKAGSRGLKTAEAADSTIRNTAQEIAKLGVKGEPVGKKGKRIPLTTQEIYSMLGGSPVGRKTIRDAATGKKITVGGATVTTKSEQARRIQLYTEQLPRLKKLIAEDPELDTKSVTKALDKAIKQHEKDYVKNLDDFGKQAYADAADRFDKNPTLWPVANTGKSLLDPVDQSTDIYKSARAFAAEGWKRRGTGTTSFHDVLGEGWKNDKRISQEFRDTAYDRVAGPNGMFKKVPEATASFRAVKAIDRQIVETKSSLANAVHGSDDAENLSKKLKQLQNQKKTEYQKQHMIKAAIFHNMLGHHLNSGEGLSPELGNELTDLLARESELNQKLLNHAGPERQAEGLPAATDELSPAVRASSVTDPERGGNVDILKETRTELGKVQRRILEIQDNGDFFPKSPVERPSILGEDFQVDENFLKTKVDDPEIAKYQDTVNREINMRVEKLVPQKVQTWLRKARADRLKSLIPDHIQSMFGHSGPQQTESFTAEHLKEAYKEPKIHILGEDIFQKDAKTALADDVTKADVLEAARRSGKSSEDALRGVADGDAKLFNGEHAVRTSLEGFLKSHPMTVHPTHVTFERLFKEQHGRKLSTAILAKNGTIRKAAETLAKTGNLTPKVPKEAIQKEARAEAIAGVNKDIKAAHADSTHPDVLAGKRSAHQFRALNNKDVHFEHNAVDPNLEQMHQAAVASARHEYATGVAEATVKGNQTAQDIRKKIDELKQLRDTKISLHNEALKEAKKARKAMVKKLDEQVTLDTINEAVTHGRNYIEIRGAGVTLAHVPVPSVLLAATAKMGSIGVVQTAYKLWSNAFTPASKMPAELNLARLRSQSRTPEIIKQHIDEIRHKFAKYKPEDRKVALRSVVKGVPVGDHDLAKATKNYFKDLVPYFNGEVKVGEQTLQVKDINAYLPEEFKLATKDGSPVGNLPTPKDIIKHMRYLKPNTDPMKIMWHMRIASEHAMAHKAMENTINQAFGVRRIIRKGLDKQIKPSEQEKLIEQLHKKHDWVTVKQLGDTHYFAPEVAADIHKLLDMMKPQNVKEIAKGYDKVIRIWKSAVTVYNPGYYTRNGIGEMMMGMFDGLFDTRYYTRAAHVVNYAMPDKTNELLKTLTPWAKHQSTYQQGQKAVVTLKDGTKLNAEDVNVLFHEVGLKSGFISSEYDHYFPAAGKLKSTSAGQLASKINDAVRNKGEKFEDYFRLAHFMYRMEKSGLRDPLEAATEAATFVRKYHFDYTDFTPTEKTIMLRAFPFYKWTRKALPLMASMLFTNPGKFMLYPKAMSNLSVATGAVDPLQDKNGIVPNYEDLTPSWMKDLFAYPVGRDQSGDETYMHVATPQFDTLSMLKNPVSASIGMLSPLKALGEQATGHGWDPKFSANMVDGKHDGQDRLDNAMRLTPQSTFANNILKGMAPKGDNAITEPGSPMDERLASFLSGLGFYENNKARQQSAIFEQNAKKKKAGASNGSAN